METALIDALKIIIARSPDAGADAVRALAAARAGSPTAQTRYQHVLTRALADPEAGWTPDERAALAAGIDSDTGDEMRTVTLRVRLTESERAHLERLAADAGTTMSEYVRDVIFGGGR